jgi:hypothetical protein
VACKQGAALFQRKGCPVSSSLDLDALKPFGDRVGSDIGFEREVAADRDGGIGPVHRCFVQPAPDPPVRRARSQESPYWGLHARQLDGVDQPLRTAL